MIGLAIILIVMYFTKDFYTKIKEGRERQKGSKWENEYYKKKY